MKTLKEIYNQTAREQPGWADKGTVHSYIEEFYESKFAPYRDTKNNVLEIGICYGDSINMWREYFHSAKEVIGVDIENRGANCPECRLIYADGTEPGTYSDVHNLDVIIDDGSHLPIHQVKSFEVLWPKLNEGGIYIIEDINGEFLDRGMFSNLHPNAVVHDFRSIKGRYDDIIIAVKKVKEDMDFEKQYQDACVKITDIHEHLPVLSELTSQCTHVTEMGVGWAESTKAFLRHDIELHSYEIAPQPGIEAFFAKAKEYGRNVTLHIADTRKVEIAETDLLFLDTLHQYEQLKEELRLHADKTKKYIVFHDTTLYAVNGEFGGAGIWPAVQEFIDSHPEWELVERRTNNNGLTILKRV